MTKEALNFLWKQLEEEILKAGEVALDYFSRVRTLETKAKADKSLVSEADLALNASLGKRLTEILPGSFVVGEESNVGQIESVAPTYIWVMDPIDGTREFLAASREWALQVALLDAQFKPLLNVVYQPTDRLLYFAMAGEGAFVRSFEPTIQTRRLHVSDVERLDEAVLLKSQSRRDPMVDAFLEARPPIQRFKNKGSLGLKAACIAEGEAQVYLNGAGLCGPWDILPCLLLLQEAGAEFVSEPGFNTAECLQSRVFDGAFAFASPKLAQEFKEFLREAPV
jgi:3'(2'), 5'-bisphosphate nucleotidase